MTLRSRPKVCQQGVSPLSREESGKLCHSVRGMECADGENHCMDDELKFSNWVGRRFCWQRGTPYSCVFRLWIRNQKTRDIIEFTWIVMYKNIKLVFISHLSCKVSDKNLIRNFHGSESIISLEQSEIPPRDKTPSTFPSLCVVVFVAVRPLSPLGICVKN